MSQPPQPVCTDASCSKATTLTPCCVNIAQTMCEQTLSGAYCGKTNMCTVKAEDLLQNMYALQQVIQSQ